MRDFRTASKRSPEHWIQFRILVVGVVLAIGFTVIIGRTVQLQVINRNALTDRAESEYKQALEKEPRRGSIVDRNHEGLAVSIDVASVCANPKMIASPKKAAESLARSLGLKRSAVLEKLGANRSFVWIKRQITPKEQKAVKALAIDGIDFVSEERRYYPMKTLASQVIGFCGTDGRGLDGLEYYYDTFLSGRKSDWTVFRDALGRAFKEEALSPATREGYNLVLTIDKNIQHVAEQALLDSVRTYSAKSGMAVVMEPKTGAILAIAHAPQFNPNTFGRYAPWVRRNRAITDSFEPGSTFKIFLAASALESGRIRPDSQFDCEDGSYKVGKHVIHDVHAHRFLSFEDVVKYSSNIGAAKIGAKVGFAYYHGTLVDFGFGTRTGVDCPGETGGTVLPLEDWTSIDAYTVCFGQGISVSALQLTSAVCAAANDGVYMKPYLVQRLMDTQGNVVQSFEPTKVKQVISVETARNLTHMLERVVAKDGTGNQAALEGYRVAGKTGTAQKVDPQTKKYAKGKYTATFVGYAPAQDPAVVILVVVDEPGEQYYGGVVAAPVFQRIAKETLQILKIHPDFDLPDEEKKITTAMEEGSWMG